jgi:hypothetical protein
MIGYAMFIVAMLVMKLAPQSPAGRWLNAALVERPMRLFGRFERHHLIFLVLIAMLAMVGTEVIFALGSVDFAVIYALDVSLYVDGLLMTVALASLVRTRSAAATLRTGAKLRVARLRRRFDRRRVRSASVRQDGPAAANEDDPVPRLSLAA